MYHVDCLTEQQILKVNRIRGERDSVESHPEAFQRRGKASLPGTAP